jgi:hypothetical protein
MHLGENGGELGMESVRSLWEYFTENFEWVFYFAAAAIWLLHLFRQSGRLTVVIFAIMGFSAALFIAVVIQRAAISIFALTSTVTLFGVSLYALICDLMLWKLAKFLTTKRGTQWTKELDYVYLTLGSVGIGATLNRFDFVTGHLQWADFIAPLVLTTAIVIRFIKTRAEIEGWNT